MFLNPSILSTFIVVIIKVRVLEFIIKITLKNRETSTLLRAIAIVLILRCLYINLL